MRQLSFPNMFAQEKVINVASVAQRSPFRYPGGKTWLVPRIRQWLQSLPTRPAEFIEPFAGGASVGLSVAFEPLALHVTLVELDEQVAAVWQAIIEHGQGKWLAEQIKNFNLTPSAVDEFLNQSTQDISQRALQTIVKNRVYRGGILASGAGKIKHGENGKGITSRWYPQTLSKRIHDIDTIRDRLSFIFGDGLAVIRQNLYRDDVVFFIDPPYTAGEKKPGRRLYNHADIDHQALFQLAATLQGQFLMTYDNEEAVGELARSHGFEFRAVSMKNAHHAQQTELLIGTDLSWLGP